MSSSSLSSKVELKDYSYFPPALLPLRRMQTMATILSLFFLSLIVLPCTDEAPEECGVEIHFHSGQGHDHEQESHSDSCSPFCACHCCHAHYLLKEYPYYSSDIEYLEIIIPYITHQFTKTSPAIWQPPRV